jgi:hypothetical protein
LLNPAAHSLDVDKFERRVGRRFDPNKPGLLADSPGDSFHLGHINILGLDLVPFVGKGGHVEAGAGVDVIAYDDVVSLLEGMQDICHSSATA